MRRRETIDSVIRHVISHFVVVKLDVFLYISFMVTIHYYYFMINIDVALEKVLRIA